MILIENTSIYELFDFSNWFSNFIIVCFKSLLYKSLKHGGSILKQTKKLHKNID